MTFAVTPGSLNAYGQQLNRAAQDNDECRRYLGSYSHVDASGKLMELAHLAHKESIDALDDTFKRLGEILRHSTDQLTGAAQRYRETDAASAARIDATLPAGSAPCSELQSTVLCTPMPFNDVREPTARLTPPSKPDGPLNPIGFMDYVSLSHWANEAISIVFGYNVIAEAQNTFIGAWEKLAIAGVAISNLADATHDIAVNIDAGSAFLHEVWHGNAADAAHAYFTTLAIAVGDLRAPIKQIGEQLQLISEAVWRAGQAVDGYITGLIDAAIVGGIAMAAGTVTAETVVGAVAGYGVAAFEIARMLELWAAATARIAGVTAVVQAILAIVEATIADLDVARGLKLPGGTGYDHPLVAG